jgi:transposase-like protein
MPNKAPAKPKRPLTSAIYHDDNAAREHLEKILWGDAGATCPRCGQYGDRITKLAGKSTRPGVYKCKDCRKPFSVTVGSVMERSHIPLCKWVMAAQLMENGAKGMSALELQRNLGTNYETAWFLFHRLRECTPTPSEAGPIGGEGKTIEIDETYIGGKEKNKHVGKRNRKNIGGTGKQVAFSLIERSGEVRSFHVANVSAKTLRPVLVKHASRKSVLNTDGAGQYRHMGEEFARHEVVNHEADEYVRGDAYTNTIEGYFALLKRGVYGNFHNVSEQHLHRYLREFDFRFNNRHLSDAERADALLAGAKGKRLLYHQADKAANV